MDREQLRDSFQFDEHRVVDEQIRSISKLDHNAVVRDRQGKLHQDAESPFTKLVHKTGFVRTFQQTRSER